MKAVRGQQGRAPGRRRQAGRQGPGPMGGPVRGSPCDHSFRVLAGRAPSLVPAGLLPLVPLPVIEGTEGGHLPGAVLAGEAATGMERTTGRHVGQVGQGAGYRPRHMVHVVEVHDRLEQAEGVGVGRSVEDGAGRPRLDEPSGVHDGEPVAYLAHDGQGHG